MPPIAFVICQVDKVPKDKRLVQRDIDALQRPSKAFVELHVYGHFLRRQGPSRTGYLVLVRLHDEGIPQWVYSI